MTLWIFRFYSKEQALIANFLFVKFLLSLEIFTVLVDFGLKWLLRPSSFHVGAVFFLLNFLMI